MKAIEYSYPTSIQDFASTETTSILEDDVLPVLEKLCRTEFTAIVLNGCHVDASDQADINFSLRKLEFLICGYLQRLANLHSDYAELYANLADCETNSSLDDFLDRQRSNGLQP